MDPDFLDQKPAPTKTKFKPKAQARRVIKPVKPKTELEDADSSQAKELLRRMQEGFDRKPKVERKAVATQVAFVHNSANQAHQYAKFPSYYEDKVFDSKMEEDEEYIEPYDYNTYYSTVLPLRRPGSGNPELLDKEEFEQVSAFDETKTNPAMELGLMDENSEPRMLLFQLPRFLPVMKRATTAAGEASASNSKTDAGGVNLVDRPCGIHDLKSGLMGKIQVYKSGAVKLKLGDAIYDVSPGSDTVFAQNVVAVNAEKKHFCAVGDVTKHVILTPDVDSILDSFGNLN